MSYCWWDSASSERMASAANKILMVNIIKYQLLISINYTSTPMPYKHHESCTSLIRRLSELSVFSWLEASIENLILFKFSFTVSTIKKDRNKNPLKVNNTIFDLSSVLLRTLMAPRPIAKPKVCEAASKYPADELSSKGKTS
jgi:hypothetical protein